MHCHAPKPPLACRRMQLSPLRLRFLSRTSVEQGDSTPHSVCASWRVGEHASDPALIHLQRGQLRRSSVVGAWPQTGFEGALISPWPPGVHASKRSASTRRGSFTSSSCHVLIVLGEARCYHHISYVEAIHIRLACTPLLLQDHQGDQGPIGRGRISLLSY